MDGILCHGYLYTMVRIYSSSEYKFMQTYTCWTGIEIGWNYRKGGMEEGLHSGDSFVDHDSLDEHGLTTNTNLDHFFKKLQ